MRKTYLRIQLPGELVDFISYVVERRLLGYRSMIEFCAAATRKEVQRLREQGFVPSQVPKVHDVPRTAIGVLAIITLTALIGLASILPGQLTGMGVWGDAFGPLAGWKVGEFYERYQGFINITLYFITFFAVLFSATKRWLDTREATILAAAFATALSIGVAMMPTNWIRQLSPLALMVMLLVLLYAVFEGLRHVGFAWIASGSIAYIIAYLLVSTHRPDLFAAIGPFGAFLHLLFFIAFIAAIAKAVREFWVRSRVDFMRAGHTARLAWDDVAGSPEERASIVTEQQELNELLKIEPDGGLLLVSDLERYLPQAEKAVRKYGYSREALLTIAQELMKLRGQENDLAKNLGTLQQLANRARAIDLDLFAKLKKRYDALPAAQKKAVKKGIEEKVAELNLATVLPRLAQNARDVQAQLDNSLQSVITELQRNQPHNALVCLERARYYVSQLGSVLTQVNDTRKAIQALASRGLKYFRP